MKKGDRAVLTVDWYSLKGGSVGTVFKDRINLWNEVAVRFDDYQDYDDTYDEVDHHLVPYSIIYKDEKIGVQKVRTFSSIQKEISNMNEEIELVKMKYRQEVKALFAEGYRAIFEQHPELECFRWTQYTPYFNDGDPCIFGLRSMDMKLYGQDWKEDIGYTDSASRERMRREGRNWYPVENEWIEEIGDEIYGLVHSIDEEVYSDMFGDGVMVIVGRTGIETEEYEHD